ncbi:MAG: BolA family transcriptional regulator [Gammaproteobacteria bacterium]|jgi:stress-induced morphogen|nr:BolA family transcriptional regulator [Gammaproteobacteria bacterium]
MIDKIKKTIETALPGSIAEPFTDDNHHFEVRVIAPQFSGKSLLAQHRMIYAALGELMNEIHALAIETKVKENV